jgi:hypothetical protein
MPAAFTCHRQANRVPVDYYTCTAVELWVSAEMKNTWDSPWYSNISPLQYTAARSLACASHNCSCSAPPLPYDYYNHDLDPRSPGGAFAVFNSATSTITIDGHLWDLPAPLLTVGLMASVSAPNWLSENFEDRDPQNASDFWSDSLAGTMTNVISLGDNSDFGGIGTLYMYNDTILAATAIVNNGLCIAGDAYSWGFSSLLLLTFCCYTSAFALALILLQTDVYWNSRHDRDHQSHSIYTDVLYLAEELKNTFGQNIEDMQHSPKAFEKKVGNWKQGLRLDVDELPLSRWQEWRQSRATKRANRKAKIAPANINDPTLELHNRGECAISETANYGLIGGNGGGFNSEAVSRSDCRSPSEKLAPLLGGVQTSTEGSLRDADGTVIEDPVAESSLLRGAVSGVAAPAGWNSRDRLPRTG